MKMIRCMVPEVGWMYRMKDDVMWTPHTGTVTDLGHVARDAWVIDGGQCFDQSWLILQCLQQLGVKKNGGTKQVFLALRTSNVRFQNEDLVSYNGIQMLLSELLLFSLPSARVISGLWKLRTAEGRVWAASWLKSLRQWSVNGATTCLGRISIHLVLRKAGRMPCKNLPNMSFIFSFSFVKLK